METRCGKKRERKRTIVRRRGKEESRYGRRHEGRGDRGRRGKEESRYEEETKKQKGRRGKEMFSLDTSRRLIKTRKIALSFSFVQDGLLSVP
jgi:hypothetical protein